MDIWGFVRAPRRAVIVFASAAISVGFAVGPMSAGAADTTGKTTVEQRLVPTAEAFRNLTIGPGEPYVVRQDGLGSAQPGRASRRQSLLYFGQLSDFQLADEESPARVEFLDYGPFASAWRTHELLLPHVAETMVRQINEFADASPLTGADGERRRMDFTVNTGDAADSQQLNETRWVRTLAEGGTLDPNSGRNPAQSGNPLCAGLAPGIADANNARRYTGVQDFDDFLEGPAPQYWDPDEPSGAFASWPSYPGLADSAQRTFNAQGLDVPHYLTFGNHDALVQGNAAANAAYELIATGCIKPMLPVNADIDTLQEALGSLNQQTLLRMLETSPEKVALVPPDDSRQFVSKKQYKQVFKSGSQADGHGFGLIDAAEESASKGAAGYYAYKPRKKFRFISLDTVSEAGVIGPSADGNIDHPQFVWLRGQLEKAKANKELVVLFSHHAIPSLTADVPDELAPPCTANLTSKLGLPLPGINDAHGHDVNPGCDLDPRDSSPIHLGADMTGLLHQYPNVIAWVAGHSHVNDIQAFPNPSGDGGFWSIRTAAEADWPQQSRLIEIFDNEDGTLSIFGTILDHAAPATATAAGTDTSSLNLERLASIGRRISYNDTQYGAEACTPGCGEGTTTDRNVELIIDDPR